MKPLSRYILENVNDVICEGKFMNFTDDELRHFKEDIDMLTRKTTRKYQGKHRLMWYNETTEQHNFEEWKEEHKRVDLSHPSREIFEPDKIYLIEFTNPFRQSDKAASRYKEGYHKSINSLDDDGPYSVLTLGFCDNYNTLHVVNFYEKDSITIKYLPRGKYFKYDDGSAYYDENFFLTRKGFKSYPIQKYKDKFHPGSFNYRIIKHQQDDTTIPVDINFCYEWSMTDAERTKIKDDIKRDIEREQKNKKFWDDVHRAEKEFVNLGSMNGWSQKPEIYLKAIDDKSDDNRWVEIKKGHCYHETINFKYKFYYTVDSSD